MTMNDDQPQSVCALIHRQSPKNRLKYVYGRDGEPILTVSRKDDKTDFGLPGGKAEGNESLVDALRREVREETGLDILRPIHVFQRPSHDFMCHTFLCDYNGSIETDEDGLVRWHPPEVVQRPDMTFSDYNQALFD